MAEARVRKTGENASFVQGPASAQRLVVMAPARFTFEWHEDFRVAMAGKRACSEYVVDFRNTDYIDSSGLGMLLVLLEAADGKPIRLINTKPTVKKILQIANFESLFRIE